MKSPTPEAKCAYDVLEIQLSICCVNFLNNILITQVRVNEGNNSLDLTFEIS